MSGSGPSGAAFTCGGQASNRGFEVGAGQLDLVWYSCQVSQTTEDVEDGEQGESDGEADGGRAEEVSIERGMRLRRRRQRRVSGFRVPARSPEPS